VQQTALILLTLLLSSRRVFNELILVPIHDKEASWEIFKVHTGKMTLAADVYTEKLVSMTDQHTSADIEVLKKGRKACSI
jgi:SpoVK/Ycf46/Vps4 family AAA+-type ATPase